jgi:hypothetical protein
MAATATLSHWNAELETASETSWLLEEPALGRIQRHLADAFAEIEKWDLFVGKATLQIQPPDENGRVNLTIKAIADLKNTLPKREAPRESIVQTPCCPECFMPVCDGQLHPENGCPYGIVEHVMCT